MGRIANEEERLIFCYHLLLYHFTTYSMGVVFMADITQDECAYGSRYGRLPARNSAAMRSPQKTGKVFEGAGVFAGYAGARRAPLAE